MAMIFTLSAIFLFAFVLIAYIITTEKKKNASNSTSNKYKAKKKTDFISLKTYYKLNKFLQDFFMTRDGYRKVRTRISDLSIYSMQEIIILAVRFYSIATLSSIAIVIMGAIIFKDLFTTLLILLFAVVIKTVLVDKQIDSLHFKLLKQLSLALSYVRQNYLRLHSIPDSISEAEVGSELRRAFDEVYLILTATDGEERLDEFYATTPFKMLQTFAGVCHIVNNNGDTKLADGSWNFIQSMSMLSNEVNLEIRRIAMQKSRFGMLEYLPLVPLATIGGIASFFIGIIPGTSVIYNGSIGYISSAVIVFASIFGYSIIVKFNSAVTVKEDDRNFLVLKMLTNKKYKNFIRNITPKKRRPLWKKQNLIDKALSKMDVNHLYGQKVLMASVAFVVTITCMFFAINLGREFIYDNVKEVSLISGEKLTPEGVQKRKEMDIYYLSRNPMMSKKETTEFVQKNLPELPEFDRSAQVDRLIAKYTSYYNTKFKWWMVGIAYIISFIAWKVPEMMLRIRAFLLKIESEEDILQLQTIIAILMNTNADTLNTLFWLERQSRVHKRMLLETYHEYPSDPEKALERLKYKTKLDSFKRIIDKLVLTIHQISLADAFSDLVTERDHVLRLREIAQTTSLNRKRFFAGYLAMTPLALVAILYLLLPLVIVGFKTIMSSLPK